MESRIPRADQHSTTRTQQKRIIIAIVSAAALTLGPGALAAHAEELPPPDTVATEQITEVTPQAPVREPADPPPPAPPAPPAAPVAAPIVEVADPPPTPPSPQAAATTMSEPVAPAPPASAAKDDAKKSHDDAEPGKDERSDDHKKSDDKKSNRDKDNDDKDHDGKDEPNGNDNPHNKVMICHATESEQNPWVVNEPNANGDVSGHAGHQDGRDIIPPFEYKVDGMTKMFPGQNWDATGMAIYENGCKDPKNPPPPPPPVKDANVYVEQPGCYMNVNSLPEQVSIAVSEMVGYEYLTLTISSGAGSASVGVTGNGQYMLPLSGYGDYSITLFDDEMMVASTALDLFECDEPPVVPDLGIVAETPDCAPNPGDLMIAVTVSGLIVGNEYVISLMSPEASLGVWSFTAEGESFSKTFTVMSGGSFEATVVNLDEDQASTSTEFSVSPCPPPVDPPDNPPNNPPGNPPENPPVVTKTSTPMPRVVTQYMAPRPPVLAETGAASAASTSGVSGSVEGAALLLFAGGLALIATGSHRMKRNRR
ncbi:hypothetical protein [Leucobacter denitrificans]|uniref:Uncharacterized protein n=1 Tax=Leucobacter denitrificans TaxID=683042 RepID=A0A7G9S2U8_9MICO|nr:hypothetical protein [Leucobacter denitrificans]QNN62173.1 hypothetical protein H9L06_07695 [Leucobacter denitrificans]